MTQAKTLNVVRSKLTEESIRRFEYNFVALARIIEGLNSMGG